MAKDINVTKLDINDTSKISGGDNGLLRENKKSVYTGQRPEFKHPMNIDPEIFLTKRTKLPEGQNARPRAVSDD